MMLMSNSCGSPMERSIFLLCACLFLGGCARPPVELEVSGPTMGTSYSLKIVAPPARVDAAAVQTVIDEVLARIDRSMSIYRSDSEISRFNASHSTEWFEVSEDLASVVQAALQFSEDSGGAFDVTVAPLVTAWGFGAVQRTPRSLPDPAALDALRASTGYEKLQVRMQPPALRKAAAEVQIDLNAIAPGYAVDLLGERLSSLGIGRYMINIGGEVRVRGRNAQGARWKIAVERPVDGEAVPYALIELSDLAVTTSGEYRRYYQIDGRRYSHTLDPRTGRPVEHSLASVAVIGPTSMYTDGWATALNVLGTQAGYDLAMQRDIAAMFIEWHDGRLRWQATPGFEAHLSGSDVDE